MSAAALAGVVVEAATGVRWSGRGIQLRGAASIGRRIAGSHRLWVVGREVEQDRRHGEGWTFSD
jgi:hypothetical protein